MLKLVADIGNTRIKWGICAAAGLLKATAVPLDDDEAWRVRLEEWRLPKGLAWTLAGTHPGQRDHLADWLRQRGDKVRIFDDFRQLPIRVHVDFPEKVGIDRLLNAVAVLSRVPTGIPAVIIDAGTAVTVDLVDGEGVFRGGAIFPGFRLIARALHDYTAQLPLIEDFTDPEPPVPGAHTAAAITAGISHTIRGGIDRLVQRMSDSFGTPRVFLAGGNTDLLATLECRPERVGPFLPLEGLRIAAWNLS